MIRLRKGDTYSLLEFIVKYDRSVSSVLQYHQGALSAHRSPWLDRRTERNLSSDRTISMEYINNSIMVIYSTREGRRSINVIITKVPVDLMRSWRREYNIENFRRVTLTPKSGGKVFYFRIADG